jgi:hypothetical protein
MKRKHMQVGRRGWCQHAGADGGGGGGGGGPRSPTEGPPPPPPPRPRGSCRRAWHHVKTSALLPTPLTPHPTPSPPTHPAPAGLHRQVPIQRQPRSAGAVPHQGPGAAGGWARAACTCPAGRAAAGLQGAAPLAPISSHLSPRARAPRPRLCPALPALPPTHVPTALPPSRGGGDGRGSGVRLPLPHAAGRRWAASAAPQPATAPDSLAHVANVAHVWPPARRLHRELRCWLLGCACACSPCSLRSLLFCSVASRAELH